MALLAPEQRAAFEQEMAAAPCSREAVDAVFDKYYPDHRQSCRYPDEWYADKDNRLAGRDTGHLRYEGRRMVWVSHG